MQAKARYCIALIVERDLDIEVPDGAVEAADGPLMAGTLDESNPAHAEIIAAIIARAADEMGRDSGEHHEIVTFLWHIGSTIRDDHPDVRVSISPALGPEYSAAALVTPMEIV